MGNRPGADGRSINQSESKRFWLPAAGLAALLLIALAYANHWQNGFHSDDSHNIVDNLAIRSLDHVSDFFRDADSLTFHAPNAAYQPLLSLSYAVDYARGDGLDPIAFHQTQFALLLLIGAILFSIYGRLYVTTNSALASRFAALFAATLFCLHTANTQTVNDFSARSSLLATVGVCASLWVFLSWPRQRRFQLHLLPMLVGALAKPIAVMYAPLLFAYVLIFDVDGAGVPTASTRGHRGSRLRMAMSASFSAFLSGAVMGLFLWSMESDAVLHSDTPWADYMRAQPFVWFHYFRLFLLPMGLTADTDWKPVSDWYDTRLVAGALFMIALGAAALWMSRREKLKPAAFGLVWFGITLLPTSSVVPLSEIYNEDRIFLPYVGLALAAGSLATFVASTASARGLSMHRFVVAFCLLLLVAHAVGTHYRNQVWRSEATLWQDVVRKSPGNGRAWMNYGLARMRTGDLEGARAMFERADRILWDYPVLEINLGIVESALGREDESRRHFLKALDLDPNDVQGHIYFARWLADHGEGKEAISHLEQALRISPNLIDARRLLARLYAAAGDRDELLRISNETLALSSAEPDFAAYVAGDIPFRVETGDVTEYIDLGMARITQKSWSDAAIVFGHVVSLDPSSAIGWNNLGWARHELGFDRSAIDCFRRAQEADPGLEVARNNYRLLASQKGIPK